MVRSGLRCQYPGKFVRLVTTRKRLLTPCWSERGSGFYYRFRANKVVVVGEIIHFRVGKHPKTTVSACGC